MLKNSYGHDRFHDADMKAAFGLRPQDKWPADGVAGRRIQGVFMWVDSLVGARGRGQTLRAMCRCPVCEHVMAVGRLNQHAGKVHGV